MKFLYVLLVVSLSAPAVVFAQDDEDEVPEFGPDESADRVEPPKNTPASPPPPATRAPGATGGLEATQPTSTPLESAETTQKERFKLFGALRLVGTVVQDDPQVLFVGRNDGFRMQNASLGVDANWHNVSVRFSAEGARDERNNANDVEGTLRFVLKDAYADLNLHHAATVRVARFLPVFELDESTSPRELRFVRRTLESRGVFSTDGFAAPGFAIRRNLGVAVRSESAFDTGGMRLGYEVAAQNGNGEFDSANDNDALAYSAALMLFKGSMFRAHAAVRYNERTEGDLPFRVSESDIGASVAFVLTLDALRAAAQVIVKRTEYPTTGGPVENGYGGHAEFMAKVPGITYLEAGYRFAMLDDSDLMPNNRVQEHTGGVNLLLPSYNLRLLLNYTHPVEEGGRTLSNDRVEALAEVSLW